MPPEPRHSSRKRRRSNAPSRDGHGDGQIRRKLEETSVSLIQQSDRSADEASYPQGAFRELPELTQSRQSTHAIGDGASNPPGLGDAYLHTLSHNVATSGSVEAEIGRLICQALDMVGELVSLNSHRFQIRAVNAPNVNAPAPPSHSRSLTVSTNSQQPLNHSSANPSSVTNPFLSQNVADVTTVSLSRSQLREIGGAFSRNPSALQPVVLEMWYANKRHPNMSRIVSPPSLLVS